MSTVIHGTVVDLAGRPAPGQRVAVLAWSPGSAASALLAPLVASDPDGVLGQSLRVWLDHNGVYDAAARELGVHRHTLTARIRSAERLLGRDFGSFEDRVRVWAALRVAA